MSIPDPDEPRAPNDRTQQVSLGCGTLILIALIVLFFSGRGIDDVRREVQALRSDVRELRRAVDAQRASLRQIQQALDRAQPPREPEQLPAAWRRQIQQAIDRAQPAGGRREADGQLP